MITEKLNIQDQLAVNSSISTYESQNSNNTSTKDKTKDSETSNSKSKSKKRQLSLSPEPKNASDRKSSKSRSKSVVTPTSSGTIDKTDKPKSVPSSTSVSVKKPKLVLSIDAKKVKDKNSGVRLMGFGHRIYKNYDPRAKVLHKTCQAVLAELGKIDEPLLKIAVEMERIALSDEYFIERKLYPNVDFYSGIIYRAMGIPSKMFTVLFAVARTVGWVAQWKEMMEDPQTKIGRPRQLFTGAKPRTFVPVEKR